MVHPLPPEGPIEGEGTKWRSGDELRAEFLKRHTKFSRMSSLSGVVAQLAKFAGAMREHGIRVGLRKG